MSVARVGDPEALRRLAEELRGDEVIGAHVGDCDGTPALGLLVAAGPRAAEAPGEYTLLFEAIREGYLLHYGTSRLLDETDPDLNLLAGDFLYALGLTRLADRGDMEAVRELGDLISLSAQLHARGAEADAPSLWLAAAVAVGAGAWGSYETHKQALRDGDDGAAARLADGARETAVAAGIGDALASAADSIGFASEHLPDRG